MKRRDLLLLRADRHARLVELPCGRLYMRYIEARTAAGRSEGDPLPADPAAGEPPSELDTPSVDALFAALDKELQSADAVRLVDAAWLAEPGFKLEVDRVLDAFRKRGGRIEV